MALIRRQSRRQTVALLGVTTISIHLAACTGIGEGDVEAVRVAQSDDAPVVGYIHDDLADALADPIPVENMVVTSVPHDGHFTARFHVIGHAFELQLWENDALFAPGFRVVRDGVAQSMESAGLERPLVGVVVGDPTSWVRVRRVHDRVEGVLQVDGRLLELRPDPWTPDILLLGDAATADYLPFVGGGDAQCGVVTDEIPPGVVEESGSGRTSSGCEAIQIGLVADYSFVSQLGGASQAEAEMTSRLNEVDGIYRDDINYGFELMEVQTFPSQGGPSFNTSSTGVTPLDQFSDWKSQNMASYGLAHLNVARTTSGTVGLAWVGATCSASNGAGVSNYLGSGRSSTIVVAHEIGHNVGSGHDSSGAAYIMAPSVNQQATAFSPQSKSSISQHLGSRSCLVPCDGGGDDGPTDTGDDAPTDTGDDAPTDTGDDAPTDTGDDAPTDTGDDAPTDTGDDAPTDTGDDAPTDTGDGTGEDTGTGDVADDGTGEDTGTGTGDGGTGTQPPPPPPSLPPTTAGWGDNDGDVGGCGCVTGTPRAGAAWWGLILFGWGLSRRRRR